MFWQISGATGAKAEPCAAAAGAARKEMGTLPDLEERWIETTRGSRSVNTCFPFVPLAQAQAKKGVSNGELGSSTKPEG
ncbi:hypothetical protein DAPPUDRAFT_233855 [Daphnia pulex]|uniref:Uncharacterized protein n=1 Tax=Daphnia pulex TaxID=6669 RepID=E9FVY1_DAPPU|nr:hypothetical protein DAPPUDRAFT_233855 [Daphnia pulex]|eukprot:EFX89021.1 hypothetical protein DAPPUDRAFT_233855 [Daphnia pulex]